jgi:hypothetical protein
MSSFGGKLQNGNTTTFVIEHKNNIVTCTLWANKVNRGRTLRSNGLAPTIEGTAVFFVVRSGDDVMQQ